MAGRRHRKALIGLPVPPRQSDARRDRMEARLAGAATPSARAGAAMDGLRMAAAHSPDRGPAALEDAVRYLTGLTRWVSGRGDAA